MILFVLYNMKNFHEFIRRSEFGWKKEERKYLLSNYLCDTIDEFFIILNQLIIDDPNYDTRFFFHNFFLLYDNLRSARKIMDK
jgi:hypothetical protein